MPALAICGACALPSSGVNPIVSERRVEFTDAPAITIRVLVQPEHAANVTRYTTAAEAIVRASVEAYGPLARSELTLVDPPWAGRGDRRPVGDVMLARTPWWELPPAMNLELNVTRGVATRLWVDAIGSPMLPDWFVAGFAEFNARRAVVRLFETRALPGGYAVLEARYFGGFVPKELPIRLYPEFDGQPLEAYRRRADVDPLSPRSPGDVQSLVAKTVLTLGTLERWLGRPVFEAAVSQFIHDYRGKEPSLDAFTRTVSAVSGQDLRWLTDQAFRSGAVIDYAIARLETARDADGSYRTTVVVLRNGNGTFSGTSSPAVGPFESGRGITIRTKFADGSVRDDTWDGRSMSKTLEYRGPAAVISAEVDPDRLILLDVDRVNNSRTLSTSGAGRAAGRWTARWSLWLQDFLLTYASLV